MLNDVKKADLIKYLTVGAASFAVDYFVFLIGYYLLGLDIRISGVISFSIAFALSFVLQKFWTFKNEGQSKKTSVQFLANGLLVIFNLAFSTFATKFAFDSGLAPGLARPAIFGLIMIWNFIIYKKIIFR